MDSCPFVFAAVSQKPPHMPGRGSQVLVWCLRLRQPSAGLRDLAVSPVPLQPHTGRKFTAFNLNVWPKSRPKSRRGGKPGWASALYITGVSSSILPGSPCHSRSFILPLSAAFSPSCF